MKKWRVGISVKFDEDFDEKISAVEKAGFDSVDFDLCRYWRERDEEIELYKHLEKGLERIKNSNLFFNGVHISFGKYWDFSAKNEAERLAAVAQAKEIFNRCDPYRPFCYVIHGSWEPISDEERPLKIEQLKKSLRQLRMYTTAKICLETLPRSCLANTGEETAAIVDAVEGIDVCMDVNHLLMEKSEDAVLRLGKRIQTTHISDFDYVNERHWMPGEGKIDWKKLIAAFEKVGYDGVWNYELALACPKTILRDRDFTYEDFIRNAKELFEGKKLTVLGRQKANLGMWE